MSFMGNMIGDKALKAHGKGEHKKALELYEQAYAKGMTKVRCLRGYSVLLIRYRHFDKALEILKVMEKQPGLTPKDKMDIHINYSVILWQKGHLNRALEILEDEFRHAQNGTLYSILGYLKIEAGDAEEALRFNKQAIEYDDEDAVFLDNLAQTYYRLLGDKVEAKKWFDKAIALKPAAIDTNYFLALYAIEAGDKETARKHLETASEGNPTPLNYAQPELIKAKLAELDA